MARNLIVLLFVFMCCAVFPCFGAQTRLKTKGEGVINRFNEAQVLKMADEFVSHHKQKVKDFHLRFYPDRQAEFDSSDESWWIHYQRKPARWRGDHFSVRIDGTTGEIQFFGGR